MGSVKNILIVTPTHTGSIFAECVTSLMIGMKVLNEGGIKTTFACIMGEAYVPMAKNKAVNLLYENKEYDSLMIVDYDLQFNPVAMGRLVLAEKDIVGGTFPFKCGKDGYPGTINIDSDMTAVTNESGLVSSSFVPGGFILIKRHVFETIESKCSIKTDNGIRFFFDTGFLFPDDHRWYGEDKTFCRRSIDAGFELWIEPNITFKHVGLSGRTGNYREYLSRNNM
ncbi:MAG: hypothetical protein PHN44_01345 [Candidatus Marinimicrobia bacterium]|nr:hypothetical protein [Candidatus Neomarinimicrobiota bacterium]